MELAGLNKDVNINKNLIETPDTNVKKKKKRIGGGMERERILHITFSLYNLHTCSMIPKSNVFFISSSF